ncbi:MAG: FGGY family pentulose kinase, partial [Acidobacteriota bacterium]
MSYIRRVLYLGIDVGTGSARAGLFGTDGTLAASAARPIEMWRPDAEYAEQSSADIWRACGEAVRDALARAGAKPSDVRGIGFDATCSLVVEGATASPTGDPARDVIVWMDHRATEQAARIDRTHHPVLRHVGGTISPEMQTPKLVWLAEQLPESFARATAFFDLGDYLAYRATGVATRSLCTTVCKWTYLAHAGGWQPDYFRAIGLGVLADEGFARIGADVRPPGERQGELTARAAEELGLAAGTPVGVALIDAHAGGVGMLGAAEGSIPLERKLAVVGGTSTCHLAVSRDPRFVPGVWGPYYGALVPGLWLTEGGQSATGALIDYTI